MKSRNQSEPTSWMTRTTHLLTLLPGSGVMVKNMACSLFSNLGSKFKFTLTPVIPVITPVILNPINVKPQKSRLHLALTRTMRFLCRRILCGLMSLILYEVTPSLSFANDVPLTNPLGSYCISKQGQKAESQPPLPIEPPQVAFSVKGKLFHVVASGGRRLELLSEDNTSLAEVRATQYKYGYKYGNIKQLILSKNGWLWIDGDETNYIARLNLNTVPPTIDPPIPLSELMQAPCSRWTFFEGKCRLARGIYSPTLDRIFVTGHPVTFFGVSQPVTLEVVDGKTKRLPAPTQSASFYTDIANLHGVLLVGSSGEPLFYDGVTVITLLHGFPIHGIDGGKGNWSYRHIPTSQRTFLTNISLGIKDKPFLVELKPDRTQIPFSIPVEINHGWLELFDFPPDNRLFVVTRHGVFTENEGKLQTVVTVAAPAVIDHSIIWQAPDGTLASLPPIGELGQGWTNRHTVWQLSNEAVAFKVRNPTTNTDTEYFIVRASSMAKCQATLDANKPLVLGTEKAINNKISGK